MTFELQQSLKNFADSRGFLKSEVLLSSALLATRATGDLNCPFDPVSINVSEEIDIFEVETAQAVVSDYGISDGFVIRDETISQEDLSNVRDYLVFLNDIAKIPEFTFAYVENWWVSRIREFLMRNPLVLEIDSNSTLRAHLESLFGEARRRQHNIYGAMIESDLMRNLVVAKIAIIYPGTPIKPERREVASTDEWEEGIVIGDSVIYVTTSPSTKLLLRCAFDVKDRKRPLILSHGAGAAMAETLADEIGLSRRVEVLDITQFLIANILEWTCFDGSRRRNSLEELIGKYNELIDRCETDPSLKIEVA